MVVGDTVDYSKWDEIGSRLGVIDSITEDGIVVKLIEGLEPEFVTAQEYEITVHTEGDYCD